MGDLYKSALMYLARREHSQTELKQKLKSKGDEAEVAKLVDSLVQQGLLSDERFTESYVRSRVVAGMGPLRIKQELKARGVSDSMIECHLSYQDDFWWDNLQQVWQKKYHGQLARLDRKEYARQARFLAARGFSQEMIIRLLNRKKDLQVT